MADGHTYSRATFVVDQHNRLIEREPIRAMSLDATAKVPAFTTVAEMILAEIERGGADHIDWIFRWKPVEEWEPVRVRFHRVGHVSGIGRFTIPSGKHHRICAYLAGDHSSDEKGTLVLFRSILKELKIQLPSGKKFAPNYDVRPLEICVDVLESQSAGAPVELVSGRLASLLFCAVRT